MYYCSWIFDDTRFQLGKTDAFSSSNKLKAKKNKFYHFSCVIVHGFLVIQDPCLIFTKIFYRRPLQPY
ncbi:hypothetical protein H5410_049613 [Solanum commersonii]|uniref:Uncharacterized protein n=1 Tax=Solanum commersonii TaxID=4109 RepID=A0A9J5WTD6_SOLCO|nr:hypothetical protein H5410_049613 [Solanum commersonii]